MYVLSPPSYLRTIFMDIYPSWAVYYKNADDGITLSVVVVVGFIILNYY